MIQSDRVLLRPWREADREPFARINADARVMEFLGPVQTREESDAAIDRQIELTGAGEPCFWAAERIADAAFLGFIGVKRISFEAPFGSGYEIGWRIAQEHWGRGYAPEGARAALDYAWATLKLPCVLSFTAANNTRSQTVMKKIGMRRVEGGDFPHPNVPKRSPLEAHVLYRIDPPG